MIYEFICTNEKCRKREERYVRLANYDQEVHKQKCDCGNRMEKVFVPFAGTLTGLDSGPQGFMRGRESNDGCCDDFTRRRVERNLGHKLNGAMFVPGLCRQGVQFDPMAVCSSRQEVIDKARALGVAVRGPGINVEPREKPPEDEGDYTPSPEALKATIIREVQQNHGGKVTRKKLREITSELQERHGQKKQAAPKIDSIYGGQ
jgi:hypothetical protein